MTYKPINPANELATKRHKESQKGRFAYDLISRFSITHRMNTTARTHLSVFVHLRAFLWLSEPLLLR